MASTNLPIPSLGNKFVDLRDTLAGDSYNWSWERPLEQVNFLVIHSTSTPNNYTPQDIANQHVTQNGWGGIGYHFLVSQDGTVFYVGDISTARANVANLNEQVLGIGLIGSFNGEITPTAQQLESTHKLCEFFISNYPELINIKSWDKLRGHKELPNQTTTCPGDNWTVWRIQIVEGIGLVEQDETTKQNAQVESLQASLAAVNQQLFSLRELLQQREAEIARLKQAPPVLAVPTQEVKSVDETLTLVGALINLYKILFPARKAEQ